MRAVNPRSLGPPEGVQRVGATQPVVSSPQQMQMQTSGGGLETFSANDQQALLMRLQGPASSLVPPPRDESYMTPERKRKRMEAMKILQNVEDYRTREEALLDLESLVESNSYLSIGDMPGAEARCAISLNANQKLPSRHAVPVTTTTAEGTVTSAPNYLDATQYCELRDNEEPEARSKQTPKKMAPPINPERLAYLLVTSSLPSFSLAPECNPLQRRCFRELLVGSLIVQPSAFDLFTRLSHAILDDAVQIVLLGYCVQRVCETVQPNGESTTIRVEHVREALRAMKSADDAYYSGGTSLRIRDEFEPVHEGLKDTRYSHTLRSLIMLDQTAHGPASVDTDNEENEDMGDSEERDVSTRVRESDQKINDSEMT